MQPLNPRLSGDDEARQLSQSDRKRFGPRRDWLAPSVCYAIESLETRFLLSGAPQPDLGTMLGAGVVPAPSQIISYSLHYSAPGTTTPTKDGVSVAAPPSLAVASLPSFSISGSSPANKGTVTGSFSKISVTFNQTIGASALTLTNYSLTGPNGKIAIAGATKASTTSVALAIASQSKACAYSLVVGKGVQDAAGASLGAATTIAFTVAAAVVPFSVASSSPAAGATVVGAFAQISVTFNRAFGSSATTASNYALAGPKGKITITGATTVNSTTVKIAFASQANVGAYTLTLSTSIKDSSGKALPSTFAIAFNEAANLGAFSISGSTPANQAVVIGGIAQASIAFNHAFGASALVAGNYTVTGPNGGVAVTGVTQVSSTAVALAFAAQTAPGAYTVTATSNVKDANGTAVGGGATFGFTDKAALGPFSLTASSPATGSTVIGTLNQLTLTFNHAFGAGALVPGNYTIGGPNGNVTVSTVAQLSATAITLTFPNLPWIGSYTVTAGAGVQDANGAAIGGTTSISITDSAAVVPTQFDFGAATSPVASGYTQVLGTTAYDAPAGFGWLPSANPIGSSDTNNPVFGPDFNITRDYNYTFGATFGVNVPNGVYDITLILGDARGFSYPMIVTFPNTSAPADAFATGTPAILVRKYIVTVTTGQLDVGITGSQGAYAVIDGMSFLPDLGPFNVVSTSPATGATLNGPISQVSVTFSHTIGAAALTLTDYTFSGPNGAIPITGVTQASDTVVNLTFPALSAVGSYTLIVGTGAQDIRGTPVISADTIAFNAARPIAPAAFEFGTASSPVANGYTSITPNAIYTPLQGYGWQYRGNAIGGLSTGIAYAGSSDPALTESFDYTTGATFSVNIPNGLYGVTLTLGDARGFTYEQAVSFGGVLTDSLTTDSGANRVVTRTYQVAVSSGRLDIGLAAGLAGSYAVIDALSLMKDSTPFAVTSSAPATGSTVAGAIDQIAVAFSHLAGAGALVPGNYSLNGPGNLAITNVVQTTPSSVTLTTSGPTSIGSYSLALAAGVVDIANQSLSAGSPINWTSVAGVIPTGFDFGTAASAVAGGYAQVTPTTIYNNPLQEYGWIAGASSVGALDTGVTTFANPNPDLTRDFNGTAGATFAVNVPNALYDVTLTLGDARSFTYTTTVSFGGAAVDTVTTGGGNLPVISKTYVVGVLNGRLDVGIGGIGNGTLGVIDGMTYAVDATPFAINGSSPANGATVSGGQSRMSVSFSHQIGPASLVAGNYSISGPGDLTVVGVAQVNANTVNLTFSGLTTIGTYNLTVGTGAGDAGGNGLSSIQSVTFNNIAATAPQAYDFGPATSPVAAGYTAVNGTTAFNAAQGFGWNSGTIGTIDTGVTGFTNPDLTRDFAYTSSGVFGVNVPNGIYDVTLTFGDARGQQSYSNGVSFQNAVNPTDIVTTGATHPVIVTRTYVVGVTTGQLDVGIGAPPEFDAVIDGMSFVRDTSPFAVSASTPSNGGVNTGTFDQISVTFSHALIAGATGIGNFSLTGPLGAIPISAITPVNSQEIIVNFADQSAGGTYALAFGAGVVDIGGQSIASRAPVEFVENIITAGAYDFGPASSQVGAGFVPVTQSTNFNSASGYGWIPGANPIFSFETNYTNFATPDPNVTRDFDYTAGANFVVNVPDGFYDVSLTLGDAREKGYVQTITFGGVLTDTVVTGEGSVPAVVTNTYVVNVIDGQLNLGIAAADARTYAVIDGMSFVPDVSPFAVSVSAPSNHATVAGTLDQISLAFTHPIASTALLPASYTLTGPSGDVPLMGASTVGLLGLDLSTGDYLTPGAYTLAYGAGVADVRGNSLAGSTLNFTVVPVTAGQFDFGTTTSAVATGWAQVTPATSFDVGEGHGWLPGNNPIVAVDTITYRYPTPDYNVTVDYNYTAGSTFAVNVANGLYDVAVTLGDSRGVGYSQTVSFGGVSTDTVDTGGNFPAVVTKTYVVDVNNGQLDVGIGGAGQGTYGAIDGLSFVPDITPLAIVGAVPANNAAVTGPIGQMSVTFNHPIGAGALLAGNYTLNGPSGDVAIAGISPVDAYTVSVAFAAGLAPGAYSLILGAGVSDAAGGALAASVNISFTDVSAPTQYDFGTQISPVAAGYAQVSEITSYSAILGYGWISGTIGSLDTGIGTYATPDSNLSRDFDFAQSNAVFGVALTNGNYSVTLILGDARGYRDTTSVHFQGASYPTDVVTTEGANAVVARTYTVTVTNGQLDLGLAAAAGSYVVIDGLTIVAN